MLEIERSRSSLRSMRVPEKLFEPPTTLRDFLTNVFVTEGERRFEDMPRQIDLGEFDDMVNKIYDLSRADPRETEYGVAALINTFTGDFSYTDIKQGDEISVHQDFEYFSPKLFAFDIHSHGKYDVPFSGTDVMNLFPRPGLELPPAVSILVTPSAKMLIARSEDTIGMQLTKDIRPDFYTEVPHERMHSLTRVAQEYRLRLYGATRNNKILTLSH